MKSITFIDTEVDVRTKRINDIGAIKVNGTTFHSNDIVQFEHFIKNSDFICGHNILEHDLMFLYKKINLQGFKFIDTLFWSPLLFPAKPYHKLLKDDKLQTEELNNPLNDAIKAKDLFFDELNQFNQLDIEFKQILFALLGKQKRFSGLFNFVDFNQYSETKITSLIFQRFSNEVCQNINLKQIINTNPIELAYCLALINVHDRYSITPPWVLKRYPEVQRIMYLLRNKACVSGCSYCNKSLDIHLGLKKFFGFDSFRTYNGEPLQEQAARAAINDKSLLAIFPTGGGKSLTFQLPALMQGNSVKGLTVVISPLQSLMKDQVDNLEKAGITDAVTINGLLDPIERAKSFERVANGAASLLYISPESLRSKSIEHLLLGRNIVRFVIDEAHCFSSWGQDFRVDYLYIGDFIKSLKEQKNIEEDIPVSCFTATAKQNVIEDIKNYFREKLNIELELFKTRATRKNLRFKVYPKGDEEEKYNSLRDLIDFHNCPTIIYVSRTLKAYRLAERLTKDGYAAKPYHGKMDKQQKTENQDAFINGAVDIMVATSAFGMGVDKKDVGMVIHYEISDSLENYIQEAGRAGRDENIEAECYVLFNEEDLSKHFILLNQTKLNIKEIQQVWKAVKDLTRFRSKISNSALEIARKAGWDDTVAEIETRVKTAIAALEESGYLKRGQNIPRIYANSILSKNAQEAIDKINRSFRFNERQKLNAIRIIKKLFSSKSRKSSNTEDAESRIDYISDSLGIVKEEVIEVINLLREEKILADTKDLTAFIKVGEDKRSRKIVKSFFDIEKKLLSGINSEEIKFHIKQLNQDLEDDGISDCSPNKIKTIFNFWAIKNWAEQKSLDFAKNNIGIKLKHNKLELIEKLEKRGELAGFIIDYLFKKIKDNPDEYEQNKNSILIEFSVHELKTAYEESGLLNRQISINDIEDTLFYLSRIDALKIEGGFLVIYNQLTIERIEKDNKKRYKSEDYKKLKQFYENKVQQIHIVGEYAKRMIDDYRDALQFVDDYFQLNYTAFLNKYFKGSRQKEIKRNITPKKFRQLFGELSPPQLRIINDQNSEYIVVAAGPGSGKTRLLVHKLASLLLMEDVKHEQLLMLTFSRAAASEFKMRLLKLIGNAANFVDIKTFHSYCFDLLGKIGSLEKSDTIIKTTIDKIEKGDVEPNRIAKTVLVIDEAQDMDAIEYKFVNTLIDYNEKMRVIAVGDDDQNIYEFRGSSSKYLQNFITERHAVKYELIENYRSKRNLVEFTNQFVQKINNRLKKNQIVAVQKDAGEIKIIKHQSENLIRPIVNDVLQTGLSGSSCILSKTNDEAIQITGLLIKEGVHAKLIQTNDSFSLYNLYEIRYFIYCLELNNETIVISEEKWQLAKSKLIQRFSRSVKLDLSINIIKDFELSNPKRKYKTDFEVFLRESKMEDFLSGSIDTIVVSTIHKAKGREFDNVFLMLNNFQIYEESKKRELYVAMTRAKNKLVIHLNNNILDGLNADNLRMEKDTESYTDQNDIVLQLSHRDIWLDYFINNQRQKWISHLQSGDNLFFKKDSCYNSENQEILKISKAFASRLNDFIKSGYEVNSVKINFILFWKKEETDKEVKIVLPEIYLQKRDQ
jgi:ATP-dependent DNA helicase RecQ